MTEYQTHAALVATLETEIVRLRAVNTELRASIQAPIQPDTKLEHAARQALEALELTENEYVYGLYRDERRQVEDAMRALRKALEAAHQPAAVGQEPVQTRERFESWVKAYSTLPLAKDSHGYADMAVEMLWHAWQAAKTNAPEGASEGESDANTRLGMAGHDSNCKHEFSVQPSSGIRLCAHCSLSEVATRKHTAPQPARQPLTDEQINDIARYKCYLEFEDDGEAIEIFARAIEKAHGIGGEA